METVNEPRPSPEDLDRERLRTYLDWGEVRAPVWYWPALAAAISAWLVGIGYGVLWGVIGALVVLAVTVTGLQVVANRSQVSIPRFSGMPSLLRRAFLPVLLATVWFVSVLVVVALSDSPRVLLGAVTGPLVAVAGAATSGLYRRAAGRLLLTSDASG
jgi:hypothetical protein